MVFIMGTLATVSLSFIENEDHQQRFEDTRKRLMSINRAVVGESVALYGGGSLLSGYAVDNGLLPGSINDLLSSPVDFDVYGLQSTIFDSSPNSVTGFNDGTDEMTLSNTGEKLFKGYRAGGYISAPPTTVPSYKDGWGNDFNVTIGPLTVTSLGADKAAGGSDYNADLSTVVNAGDWQVDIEDWQVTMTNTSNSDIDFTGGGGIGLSLLVYENDADAVNTFNWKRFTTNLIDCLDAGYGSEADGDVNGSACASSRAVNFPAGGYPSGALDTTIPQGRHLLVLIEDSNGTLHDGASDQPCTSNCNTGTMRTSQQVTFHARTVRPEINIVIH